MLAHILLQVSVGVARGDTKWEAGARATAAAYAAETLAETLHTNNVVIFSRSDCDASQKTKEFFEDLGVSYVSLELDARADGEALEKALVDHTGVKGMWPLKKVIPRVFVRGQHVGGEKETAWAYKTGELEHLVSSGDEEA